MMGRVWFRHVIREPVMLWYAAFPGSEWGCECWVRGVSEWPSDRRCNDASNAPHSRSHTP